MVFRFLAVMIFGFLLLGAVTALFERQSRPVNKVAVKGDIKTSSAGEPGYPNLTSPPSQKPESQARKASRAGREPDEPASVSPAIMKDRLQRLGAVALERIVRFDPAPLDRNADAPSSGLAEVAPQSIVAESFQATQNETVAVASASRQQSPAQSPAQIPEQRPELLLPNPPQELQASEPEDVPQQNKPEQVATNVETLSGEQASQVKSRLHDLGFLSLAKSGAWDASARNALRDFKVANNLRNDDTWDLETSDKLSSQAAIRADHSIIGNWSSVPCRSAKPTDTRLSISSRRARSSAGSICEFHDLKATTREWRVKATCSQGGKHWNASGKFSLTGEKLVWTSERDVISYFRCN